MGQIITWLTGGIEKRDINLDYQTYGDGDAYVIDGNGEYQPSDYDQVEERNDGMRTQRFSPPKVRMAWQEHDDVKWNCYSQQQAKRSKLGCNFVCVAIFCLTLLAVGLAGGTAFYFVYIAPTRGNRLKNFQKLQVPST